MGSHYAASTDSLEIASEEPAASLLKTRDDPLYDQDSYTSDKPTPHSRSSGILSLRDVWKQTCGERRLVRSFSGGSIKLLVCLILILSVLYYLLFSEKVVDYRKSFLQYHAGVSDPFSSGSYDGPLRPQVHFSPPRGFMNDPNGMFLDADGLYHLYYQYNPNATTPGNQHWGHATSRDLYTWENQPIAIYPLFEGAGMFSGSCVIDSENTSGFFPNQRNGVVAMYTLHTASEERQHIAFSTDGGYTFTEYDANPVLSIGNRDFRDPKVLWHAPTKSWVAVIAHPLAMLIGIYTSPDLLNWTHVSNFAGHGLDGVYECPNLVAIPMLNEYSVPNPFEPSNFALDESMYVMIVSINPGGPLGGSITQYFPGHFNGTHFEAVDGAARLTDFAKDSYAVQFFHGIPSTSAQIGIAWASNWQYAGEVPTGELEGFRSVMSLPRYQALANTTAGPYRLLSYPVGLEALHTTSEPLARSPDLFGSSLVYKYDQSVPSRAITFSIDFAGIPSEGGWGWAEFTVRSSTTGDSIRGGFYLASEPTFWIDRGNSRGFKQKFFTTDFSTYIKVQESGILRVLGVIDRSIMELFLDNGAKVATVVFYPESMLDTIEISMTDINTDLPENLTADVEVWGLKSSWDTDSWADGVGTMYVDDDMQE